MDKYVKQSIESRKQAIGANYKIDASMQRKIDDLFSEIQSLGSACKDVGDFENKFAASPLNQQYLDLFTEIATTAQPKSSAPKPSKGGISKMVVAGTAAGIAESAADQAVDTVLPTRAAVHQQASDAARNIPILGDAIDIGQKASYASHLGKLFKSRKKKK